MPRNRVLLLIGPSIANAHTLATFLKSNLNVVGVCIANRKNRYGFNSGNLSKKLERQGAVATSLQLAGKVCYSLTNRAKDSRLRQRIFDKKDIESTIAAWDGPRLEVANYESAEVLQWIKDRAPDYLVIHTPVWVGKKIRDLVENRVIGGHPGITPLYRGVHASFWAAYNQDFDRLGYSVFWVDKGVDTGDLIFQARLDPEPGDSFITHGWRGMKAIAQKQVEVLSNLEQGVAIPRTKHNEIPAGSNYPHPTIFQYLRYRRIQKKLR